MQDDFRKKTSRRFSDEMKQMKQQAAEAAAEQKKIAETLENQKSNDIPGDASNSLERVLNGSETARKLEEQGERVEKLMEEMKRVSEQAEGAEPLLSQKLYDAVRKAHTGGLEENLDETRQYARMGERSLAQDAERKATKAVEELQKGVDKAAESVLGSESDALRMARAELDALINEMKPEAGGEPADSSKPAKSGPGDSQAEPEEKSDQTAKAGKSGDKPGEEGKPSDEGKPGEEGKLAKDSPEANSKGQGKGKAEGKEASTAAVGEGQGEQPGKDSGQSKQGQGQQAAGTPQQGGKPGQQGGQRNASGGGGGEGGLFFDAPGQSEDESALTGKGYQQWTDRLRNVEELLNQPELRNEAARVLDNVRSLRMDAQRGGETPQAGHVQARITNPLVELRDRVAEELAKREGGDSLAPVDRDPVPQQYRDLVRKYYQELGEGK
jgi:hypothetical protein